MYTYPTTQIQRKYSGYFKNYKNKEFPPVKENRF